MLKSFCVLSLSLACSGLACADFTPVGDGQIQVAYEPTDVAIQQATTMSCREARDTAWFVHELSRTDGEADPEVAFTPCGPALLAASTADAN